MGPRGCSSPKPAGSPRCDERQQRVQERNTVSVAVAAHCWRLPETAFSAEERIGAS